MKAVFCPFMLLAAVGLALCLGIHAVAFAGHPAPYDTWVKGLALGMFLVWFAAVFAGQQMIRYASRKHFWLIALSGCPDWMREGLLIVVVYGVLNFMVYAINGSDRPRHVDEILPPAARNVAGVLMGFYGVAFCVLYSRIHTAEIYRERECPQGHPAGPNARVCPECGYDFTSTEER